MTKSTASLLLWAPRVAGLAIALFLAAFALDAFAGKPFLQAVPDFLIHLAPAACVLAIVAVAWRVPAVGAIVFPGLAVLYAMSTRRLDWIAVIGGPLVFVGLLFFLSWRLRAAAPAGAP